MDTKLVSALCTCLAILACSRAPAESRAPDSADVDRLERRLAGHSCVGALDRWERRYLFPMRANREIDETVIVFDFRQAGVHEFRARRVIEDRSPDSTIFNLDHRQFRIVSGGYDLSSGRLTVECGWNCGASVPIGGGCG